MKRFPFLVTACLGTLLTSCGASVSTSEVQIYGGKQSSPSAWPSTVAITDGSSLFCSGMAIHPRVVMTAAHCLNAAITGNIYVYQGAGIEGGQVGGPIEVEKKAMAPNYGDRPGGMNDIAYLVLKEPLNLSAGDYVPVLTDPAEIKELIQIGTEAKLVGFGKTDTGVVGVKYETEAKITSINTNEVTIGGSGHDACQGDSGGPAYAQLANGEWRVFGVVSRGYDCGSGGQWGLLHSNICWVQNATGFDLNLKGIDCPAVDAADGSDAAPSQPAPYQPSPDASLPESSSGDDPHPAGFDYGDAYGGYYGDYYRVPK